MQRTEVGSDAEQRANFQRLFEAVIGRWVSGEIAPQDVESWQKFCARVNRGLSAFLANGEKGESVVIFSSGGPISVAMQRALNLSAQKLEPPDAILEKCLRM